MTTNQIDAGHAVTADRADRHDAGHPKVKGWLAVLAVTLGIFALMTSELLPVGLLTPVGAALGVSEGTAGLLLTVPGLVAAVSAPVITVLTGRVDRRLMLALLVGAVGAANLASAFATGFAAVLAARVLVGISVGGFWSLAGGIAVRLVPERHVTRATALIFGGVEAATVLGVPAGTLIGDLSGWRTAFAAVGLLGLAALAGMLLLLPPVPPARAIAFADLPRVFRGSAVARAGIAMTFLIITGHFVAYTFVRPILLADGVGAGLIGTFLLGFGVAGLCGNFLAGALVARWLRGTLIGIAVVLTVAMLATAATGWPLLLLAWGLAYGAVPVTMQTWMLGAEPAANSLYVSTFNVSIALGALLGGLVADALPIDAVLWIGAALVILTVFVAGRHGTR